LAAAEKVEMEVIDRLATVFAGVDYDSISLAQVLVTGNQGCGIEKMAEKIAVLSVSVFERSEVLARNDEDVDRRLRMNVRERVAELVLVDGGGGDGTFGDFAEEAGHEMTSRASPVYNCAVESRTLNSLWWRCLRGSKIARTLGGPSNEGSSGEQF
jgi:hypothetical protein